MLLFRSEEHVAAGYRRRGIPTGATLSLEQQWELARIWYADRMSPDWRRRTAEEAEAVFASLGLVGDFWRLTGPTG
jgi:hypothetical protein